MDFLRKHDAANATILSICTGTLVVAYAGLVQGKKVTAPRFLIPGLRKQFPGAALWDDSVRVVRDGNLWTSGGYRFFPCFLPSYCGDLLFIGPDLMDTGGITNGHDLVAEYLRENYPAPLVNSVLAIADGPQRPLQYESSPTHDNVLFSSWQT